MRFVKFEQYSGPFLCACDRTLLRARFQFTKPHQSERHKIADRHLQVKLDVEIFLGGLDVRVPQQDADLLDGHARPPSELRVGAAQVVRLQVGFADQCAALLHDIV